MFLYYFGKLFQTLLLSMWLVLFAKVIYNLLISNLLLILFCECAWAVVDYIVFIPIFCAIIKQFLFARPNH